MKTLSRSLLPVLACCTSLTGCSSPSDRPAPPPTTSSYTLLYDAKQEIPPVKFPLKEKALHSWNVSRAFKGVKANTLHPTSCAWVVETKHSLLLCTALDGKMRIQHMVLPMGVNPLFLSTDPVNAGLEVGGEHGYEMAPAYYHIDTFDGTITKGDF